MMSSEALHQFWAQFGWKTYDEYSVPSEEMNPPFPRLTHESRWGAFNTPLSLTASLWDRSTSWQSVEQKAEEIFAFIGAGAPLPNNSGRVWIDDPSSFAQRFPDPDPTIRRIILNVKIEFFKEVI